MVVVQGVQKIRHRGDDTTPEIAWRASRDALRMFEEARPRSLKKSLEKKGLLPRTIRETARGGEGRCEARSTQSLSGDVARARSRHRCRAARRCSGRSTFSISAIPD
jgi:hypothetical protein